MRLGALSFVAMPLVAMCLCGCGYMGEPLPPALNRPERVQDIAAVQRGSNIHIQFTVPQVTTENLPLKKGSRDIELRIGPPPPGTFSIDAWLRTADRVPMVSDEKPTAYVDLAGGKVYRQDGLCRGERAWAIRRPDRGLVKAGSSACRCCTPDPARRWSYRMRRTRFISSGTRARRNSACSAELFRSWTGCRLATSAKPSYTDGTIEYGKTYEYEVQSIEKTDDTYAESELSEVKTIKPVDKFAPAVPSGVTAVPGTRSIELVWNRNTEKDFASYNVYRDGMKIADGLTAPAFSDRGVQPKVKVQYQVSAVDTAGNESARSAAVEATIP